MSAPHGPEVVTAAETVHPESAEALAAEIARARAAGRRVLPAGHGSRLAAAGVPREADVVVSTRALGRVLQYEPADLTVTVEAGCTLAELDRVLAERGQILPLQPGRARGTVGGLIATAPEGATALAYGGVRDSLIGLRAALADGTIVKGGGRVVKNVAGYGVHRLMAGSHGTLGIIVEASFKVRPRPEARGTVVFELESDAGALGAARRILDAGLEPVFVDVFLEGESTLLVAGFEGMKERVAAHVARATELVAPEKILERRVLTAEEDARLRRALDDWSDPEARIPGEAREGSLRAAWQQSVKDRVRAVVHVTNLRERVPLTAQFAHLGTWKGDALSILDIRSGAGTAFVLIEADGTEKVILAVRGALENARKMGSAVLLVAPRMVAASVDVWGPPPPDFFLMKKIKQALDPAGVFAAGGFVGGL